MQTVVFVADPSLGGNILNFNVGTNLDLLVPSNFWSRLAGKFGSKFYWQDKGEGETIVTTVSLPAISWQTRREIDQRKVGNMQELGREFLGDSESTVLNLS